MGACHVDVRTESIYVAQNGCARLSDFGDVHCAHRKKDIPRMRLGENGSAHPGQHHPLLNVLMLPCYNLPPVIDDTPQWDRTSSLT